MVDAAAPAGPSKRYWGGPMLLVAIIAALPAFAFGTAALTREWMTPTYSHGPLIPIFAAFLLLRGLRDTPPAASERSTLRWPGIILVLFGLALAFVGSHARVADLTAYGLVPFVGGLILLCLGWPRARQGVLPTLMLIFMLPLPQLLYWKVTLALQAVSSRIGVAVIEAAGIPVFLDGNVIDLGVYKLQVAEACSGLQYVIPVLSLALMLAALYRGPTSHKAVLLVAAIPVTVGLNALRIGMVGISVNSYGIEAAESLLHAFEGWAILLACVLALVLILWLLRRTMAKETRPHQLLDLDPSGFGAVIGRLRSLNGSRSLALAIIITGLTSLALLTLPKPGTITPPRANFALFPNILDDRTALRQTLPADIVQVLGADDYLDATFVARDGREPINIFASYYADQSRGAGLHSPEICLPANGWEIASFGRHTLSLTDTAYGTFDVNRATIRKGLEQQLVYYWFEGRNKRETNDILAKFTVLIDALRTGRTDGALVRFITPIENGDLEAADARLTDFISTALPHLPDFVPL